MPSKPSALTIENLSFSYQDCLVLKDISFEILPGEFVGVIGPNGGGKTTLLKLIMGFLKPKSGSLKIFDKSPLHERRKISYVPQNLRFDRQFPISVMELVLGGRLSHLPWYGRFS
jgi:zinc transport system ATP-binding protein